MNDMVPMTQQSVETYGSRSLTAADVQAQINLMQDVMRSTMIEGTHYGKIPGTQSVSLFKAGAEKLLATFRLAVDPAVDDLSKNGEIHYRVKVGILGPNGQFLGAGMGECSSQEDKYAWRTAVCPEEFDATPENRRRVKWAKWNGKVEQKKQVRTNPADVGNTILKMAKKRAQVDATITVTAASDIFTQDIEDLPDELREHFVQDARRDKPAQAAAAPVVETPEVTALAESLLSEASKGREAFGVSWAALSADQRNSVGHRVNEFKARCEKATAA